MVHPAAIYARLDRRRGYDLYSESSPRLPERLRVERAWLAIEWIGSSMAGGEFEFAVGHARSRVDPAMFHVFFVLQRPTSRQPCRYVVTLTESAYGALGFDPFTFAELGGFRFGAPFHRELVDGPCDEARLDPRAEVRDLSAPPVAGTPTFVLSLPAPSAEALTRFRALVEAIGAEARSMHTIASFAFTHPALRSRLAPLVACFHDTASSGVLDRLPIVGERDRCYRVTSDLCVEAAREVAAEPPAAVPAVYASESPVRAAVRCVSVAWSRDRGREPPAPEVARPAARAVAATRRLSSVTGPPEVVVRPVRRRVKRVRQGGTLPAPLQLAFLCAVFLVYGLVLALLFSA